MVKKFLVSVILLLFTVIPIFGINLSQEYNNMIDAFERNDLTGMVEKANNLMIYKDQFTNLELAQVYYIRGYGYSNLGNWEQGISDYDNMFELTDKYSLLEDAYFNRGICYKELGQYESAIWNLNKTFEFESKAPDVYKLLSEIYVVMENPNKAIEILTKGISYILDDPDLYNERGIIYYNQNKYTDAVSDFHYAVNYSSLGSRYLYLYNASMCYKQLEKYDEAVTYLHQCVELKPDHYNAHFNLFSMYYYYLFDDQAALKHLESYFEFNPDEPTYFELEKYTELLELNGFKVDALAIYPSLIEYAEASELETTHLFAKMAEIQMDLGYYEDASNSFLKALDTCDYFWDPFEDYYRGLGYCYARLHQSDLAILYYDLALEVAENVEYRRELAELELAAEYYELALEDFTIVIHQGAPHISDYENRVWLNAQLGNYQEVVDDMKVLIKLNPSNYAYYSDLGKIFYHTEQYAEAVAYFTHALDWMFADEYYWTQEMYLRAYANAYLGNYEAAVQELIFLTELDETVYEQYELLGMIYEHTGNFAQAADAYQIMYDMINSYYTEIPDLIEWSALFIPKIDELKSLASE